VPIPQLEAVARSAQRIPTAGNLSFLDRGCYVFFKERLNYPHDADWTPFQTHDFSENVVAVGMEPRTSGSDVKNSDLQSTEAVIERTYFYFSLPSVLSR
jgi:hypothetical protein